MPSYLPISILDEGDAEDFKATTSDLIDGFRSRLDQGLKDAQRLGQQVQQAIPVPRVELPSIAQLTPWATPEQAPTPQEPQPAPEAPATVPLPSLSAFTPWQPDIPDQPSGLSRTPQASATPTFSPADASARDTTPVQPDTSSPDAFLNSVTPAARAAARAAGLPDWAGDIAAGIASNETGYGKFASGNNYFGIKGCHDARTDVLTARGWAAWSDVRPGDVFATVNPATLVIEYQHATRLVRYSHSGPMVRVKSDQADLLVTPDHRMWVRLAKGEPFQFLAARAVVGLSVEYGTVSNVVPAVSTGNLPYGDGVDVVAAGKAGVASPCAISDQRASYIENVLFGQLAVSSHRSSDSPVLRSHVRKIGKLRPEKQMAWPHAGRVVATVQDVLVGPQRHVMLDFVRDPVSPSDVLVGDADHPIALRISSSGPQPTRSQFGEVDRTRPILVDFGPEASFSRLRARPSQATSGHDTMGMHLDSCGRGVAPSAVQPARGHHSSDYTPLVQVVSATGEWSVYDGEVFCATVPNGLLITRRNGKTVISGNSNPRTGANTGAVDTWEVVNGQRQNIQDTFRAYDSPQESFDDFFRFLKDNPRYAGALQAQDPASFIKDIHAAGYATDPNWSNQVLSIAGKASSVPGTAPTARTAPILTGPAVQGDSGGGSLDVAGLEQAYAGQPYVFGGAGGRGQGLGAPTDCSGFVAAWAQSKGVNLPAHTDAAYNEILNQTGRQVSSSEARPGDIVFYMGAGTGGAITHHMGIYAGPGKVLDMSVANGGGVQERDISHAGQYVILRDERLSGDSAAPAQAPGELAVAPPIVPSQDSGGNPAAVKPLPDDPQANFRAAIGGGKGDNPFASAFRVPDTSGDSTYGPFDPPGYGVDSASSSVTGRQSASPGADSSVIQRQPASASVSDSTYGPFDPPGYADAGNPDQPSGLTRTPRESVVPTFAPQSINDQPAPPPEPMSDREAAARDPNSGGIGGAVLGGLPAVGQAALEAPGKVVGAYQKTLSESMPSNQFPMLGTGTAEEESARFDNYRQWWNGLTPQQRQMVTQSSPLGALLDPNTTSSVMWLRRFLLAQPQAVADAINAALPEPAQRESLGVDLPVLGRVGIADVLQLPGRAGRVQNAVQGLGGFHGVGTGSGGFGITEVPGKVGGLIQRGADAIGQGGPVRRAGELIGELRDLGQLMTRGLPGGAPVASVVDGVSAPREPRITPDAVWTAGPNELTPHYLDLQVDGENVAHGLINVHGRPNAARDPAYVPGNYWAIANVEVPAGQRGRGYGNAWYREVLQKANAEGADGIVTMNPSDDAARVYDSMRNWPGVEVIPLESFAARDLQTPRLVRITDPEALRAARNAPDPTLAAEADRLSSGRQGTPEAPGGLLPSPDAASPGARLAGQAVGGALSGGYAASQEPGADPGSIARGALLGAAGGVARGAITRRGGVQQLARAVERTSKDEQPNRLILPGDHNPTPTERTIYGPGGEAISTPRDALPPAERSAVDPGHIRGFGYSEGLSPAADETLRAASTNEKAFGRVSREDTAAAAKALALDPTSAAALQERALAPGFTRTAPAESEAARIRALGAVENVSRLQADVDRLKAMRDAGQSIGDLPVEEQLAIAERALQAGRDSAVLSIRASRRYGEAAGRTLNAMQTRVQAQQAQMLASKAELLARSAKEAAPIIEATRKGRRLSAGDLDKLEQAADQLDANGHLAGESSPAVDAIRKRLAPEAKPAAAPAEPSLAQRLGDLERAHDAAHGGPAAKTIALEKQRDQLLDEIQAAAQKRADEMQSAGPGKELSPEEIDRAVSEALGAPTVAKANREALIAAGKEAPPSTVAQMVKEIRDGERMAIKDQRKVAQYWADTARQFPDEPGYRHALEASLMELSTHGPKGQAAAGEVRAGFRDRLGRDYDAFMAGVERRNQTQITADMAASERNFEKLDVQNLAQQIRDFVKAARTNPDALRTGPNAWGDSRLTQLHEDLMLAGKNGTQRSSDLRQSLYKAGVTKLLGKVDDNRLADIVAAVGRVQSPEEMGTLVKALRQPRLIDYLYEIQYVNMLSSPVTHLNNAAQNGLQLAGRLLFNPLTVAGDTLLNRGNRVTSGAEVGAAYRGAASGLRQGLQEAAHVMRTGERPGATQQAVELGNLAGMNREYLTEKFGPLGTALHMVSSRPLEAMDALLGHMAYASAIEQGAVREANNLLRAGDASVKGMSLTKAASTVKANIWDHPNVVEQAGKVRDYTLLRGSGDSPVERWLQQGAALRNAPVDAGFARQAGAFLANQALPFFSVPLNYAKQGLDRSLGAPINTVRMLAERDPVQRAELFKRAAVGYGIMGTAMALAAGDNLTGDGPSDKAKRDLWLTDHVPNSVRLPGSQDWHSYQGTPWGLPFAIVANTKENMDEALTTAGKKDLPAFETGSAIVQGALRGTASGIANQTFLQNLGQMYGQFTGTQDAFPALATGTASRFIQPSLVRWLARVTDDMERDATHGQTSQEQIGQRLASGYPGARETLPARQDVLGKVEPNQARGLPGLAPPFLQTRQGFEPGNPIVKAFTDAGVTISRPPDHLTLDVKGGAPGSTLKIPMQPDEARQWNTLRGQALEQSWQAFQRGPNWSKYQQGDPGYQHGVMDAILNAANDSARDQIVKQLGAPEIRRRATPAAER